MPRSCGRVSKTFYHTAHHGVAAAGLSDGRRDAEGRRCVRHLRQLQRAPARLARRLRLLQGGRGRRLRAERPHRDRRRAAVQHQRRHALRELHAELEPPARAGAPVARRARRAPGARAPRSRSTCTTSRASARASSTRREPEAMATPRPIRSMDPYAEQFWAYTQKKELRLQQCSRVRQVPLAAGADVRPLPVRSMRVGADARAAAKCCRGRPFIARISRSTRRPTRRSCWSWTKGRCSSPTRWASTPRNCARAWCSRCNGPTARIQFGQYHLPVFGPVAA